ncbi:V-type proton ATPase subunit E-like isoform X2 [Schistocerca gregaria]|uniref:V-type proton ATPase subunit E-like isoform X2 n=1 Tax=Schistocerca gregaria TaxID=7010 RepID=UPI00211E9A80|nr:V-type proton ATPase subunit E-like isoform X2 [Schistocerca gregaria]
MPLTRFEAQRRMNLMLRHIEVETDIKIAMIQHRVEEEFTKEKAYELNAGIAKIQGHFKAKEERLLAQSKAFQAVTKAKWRLEYLKAREECVWDVINGCRYKMRKMCNKKPHRYVPLLEKLIVQGLVRMLEIDVEIMVRKKDRTLISEVLPVALDKYRKITGVKKLYVRLCPEENTNEKYFDEQIGGIYLFARGGKITLDDTFETRLIVIISQIMPEYVVGAIKKLIQCHMCISTYLTVVSKII